MSKLDDYHLKVTALLEEIAKTRTNYYTSAAALRQLQTNEQVNLAGFGMMLHVGDSIIPVPVPTDIDVIADHLAAATNFLAQELTRLWGVVAQVSAAADQYCQHSMKQAAEEINQGDDSVLRQSAPPQHVAPGGPPLQSPGITLNAVKPPQFTTTAIN